MTPKTRYLVIGADGSLMTGKLYLTRTAAEASLFYARGDFWRIAEVTEIPGGTAQDLADAREPGTPDPRCGGGFGCRSAAWAHKPGCLAAPA